MKQILIISALDIWSMGRGKGAPSLWQTLKGYADNGWKVFFITANRDEKSLHDIYKNIEIIRFDTRWARKNRYLRKTVFWLYFQIRSFIEGCKIAKRAKIDVFYGYEIHGVPIAKILSKIFHGVLISRFQGTKLSFHLKDKFWRIKYWDDILSLKTHTDLLIMTNDGTQGDRVLSKLNVDREKVRFWLNGVDKNIHIPNFDKDKFKNSVGIRKNERVLLTVSRLEKWKRVDRIIKAMPETVEDYPCVKLLIIGEGEERKSLEKLASDLQLEKYIKFLGALPHNELKNYYNLGDIFISMYDISNVGNPLLEAMSCGKCIVTLNTGDTNRFVHNSENGVLLEPNELSKLPKTIVELLKNDEERKRLGADARKFGSENFWTWAERMKAEITEAESLSE